MLLAAGSVERALGENANKSEIGDVPSQVTKLKEGIEYSDRGGVAATADIEQSIASGLRELSENLATLGADGVEDTLATIRSLNAKLGERNDLLKLKK